MDKPITIVIADDEQLIRSGLQIMLETFPDIKVAGLAENGQEAFQLANQHDADLVLMDIRMPGTDGIEGTRLIKKNRPDIAVLIVTTFQDTDYIVEAMGLGASGYLLKDSSHQEIYNGIKLALAGKIVMDAQISNILLQETNGQVKPATAIDFTPKELELIKLIAAGLNNKEIAQSLFLSEGTVKNNISNLLLKAQLRDRTQLAIFAYRHGLN